MSNPTYPTRYPNPEVTYHLTRLADGREVGQYQRVETAWSEAAYHHLSAGGDPEVATRMLRCEDTSTIYEWQVGRHCDTTTHTVHPGWELAATWCDALSITRRSAFEATYVTLASALVEGLLEDALSGLDVVLRGTDTTLTIGIVTAVDDYGVLTFADGKQINLLDSREIHATHGGL